jgi:uncharacterized repeat protein (TIGR01451 family)
MRQLVARTLSAVLLLFVVCLPSSFFGQDQSTKKPIRSSSKTTAKEVTLRAGEGPVVRAKTPVRKDRRTPSAGRAQDEAQGEDQGEGDAQPAVAPSFRVMTHPREDLLVRGHEFQGDLRTLPPTPPEKFELPEFEGPKVTPVPYPGTTAGSSPSAVAVGANPPSPAAPAPTPSNSFDGLDFLNWGAGHPPDPNGDVGPTYYIQTINTSVGIFRKSDGVRVAAFTFNTFMSQGSFGNLCDTNNFGDPVVVYDTFEDRWIITDFAFQLSGGNVVAPEFQCFAVSKSGDPVAGGWNFYSIQVNGGFGDYPKFGIWPDGLYMAANIFGFGAGGSFQNVRVWAFNKAQMYAGIPAIQVLSFDAPSAEFTLLPSNARLQTGTPPTGSPDYYATVFNFTNAVSIYKFHVDWNSISTSTFSGPFITIAPSSWASPPSTVPSGTGGNGLDTLAVRLMVQNQYTNIGGVESLWDSHTIQGTTAASAAPRYYQVVVTGGTVAAATTQASTFNPDASAVDRFMPSVAVDRAGDMAIGYSGSSSTLFPAIRYAGRLAGDPVNSITLTETSLIEGTGTQTGSCGATCIRWGDYTAMTLDPNGCTFWYTNMYYQTTGLNFNTRIGAFSFPSCTPVATGTVSGKVTAAGSGNPISGATVALGSRTATTAIDGTYSFAGLPSGTYPSIAASFAGFNSSTTLNVLVSDGATTTVNFSLTAAPTSGCLTDTTEADFQGGVPTNCDLTSSPGNVILLNTATIDQQNTSVTNNGFGFTSTSWAGQTFTAGVTGQLTRVDLDLFCFNAGNDCTGPSPNITVSIRATSGSPAVPTGADLATATIPGFTSAAGGYFSATFSSPPTLIAGTRYAVIFHAVSNQTAPATYAYVCSCTPDTNPYAPGQLATSTNSGSIWTADPIAGGRDLGFKIFMQAGFAPSGTFVSSLKDANPAAGATPTWSTLSWTASTPTNTSIQFQAAASNSASGPFNFVGPDGTAGTFFSNGGSLAQFNGNRYLKYKASLSTTNSAVTPTLNDVTVCFNDGAAAATTLAVAPASGSFAGTANLSATLTSSSTGVSGKTVTFTLNGNSAGSGVTDGSGLATVSGASLTGINAGSYPNGVAATFAGDSSFAASSGSNTLTVSKANQTITFGALAGKTFGDPDFSVSASASSGLAVTFTAGGNCSVTGSTVHLTGAGSCTITAAQAGNGNYNPAPVVPQSFSIAAATAPTITKTFAAATIPLNGTASLTFTIHNPNATATLTGLAFTDSLPAGLVVASTPNLNNNCGGTATAVGSSSSVSLSGGTLAASASCTVSVNVTGTTPGVKNNSVQVTSTEGGAGNTSNASITVVTTPTISKTFGAASVILGRSPGTTLTFTITNPNASTTLTGIGFTDTMPNTFTDQPLGLTGSCPGGTITAPLGSPIVNLSGATLAPSASCTFSLNVVGSVEGRATNVTSGVTSVEGGTGATASATINAEGPPSIAKVFNPSLIAINGTSALTFTITNPSANGDPLTGVAFNDTLPAGLTVANSTAAVCGGTLTTTAPTGIALSGSSIAVNSQCQFAVTVTGVAAGQYTNTTGAVTSANGGTGTTAAANLTVAAPPSITKAFGAAAVPLNGTASLTFNIKNPNGGLALTGLAFTDSLPPGLIVATPSNLSSTCGGTATATAGSGSVSLSGGTVAAGGSCTVSVNITGTTAGVKNNSVQVTSTEGGAGNTSNASITVATPPSISKAFGAASIPLGGSATLQFTIQNNNATLGLTGIAFSDTLPAGLIVATPNQLTGSCGAGTITAVQTTNLVRLSGGTIAANSSCSFTINVTGTAAGQQNNTTGAVTSTEGGTGGTASASLTVVAPPSVAMVFNPSTIAQNATTSLIFTITNPAANTAALTNVGLADSLPAGLTVADSSATVCGGTLATISANGHIILGGVPSIAANSQCQFSVTVTGAVSGQYTNTTGNVTSANGSTGNTATANLTVATPPTITKAFGAATIPLNGTTSLTFTIQNSNTTLALTGVTFGDILPIRGRNNLVIATPNGLSGSCGGGTISASPGTESISLSGATLPASSSCTFSLNVTGNLAGDVTNTTGNVSSNESGLGATASASISIVGPPSIAKVFNPAAIALNATTSLTFTITNPAATVGLTGVAFTDTLPTGLTVANSSAPVCGGTLTTTAPTSIALSGASIAATSQCQFSVTVTGGAFGLYTNTTGAVTSTNGGTGNLATANLAVASPPAIIKQFGAATVPLNGTTSLTFTINNPNTGVALTGLAFTDNLPAGLVVASTPNLNNTCAGTATAVGGASSVSLSAGTLAASASCTASVNVTGTTAGAKNNSVQVTSTEGGAGNTSNASITVTTPPVISKAFGAAGIPLNGSTSLTFTIQNGSITTGLTGVAFSDALPAGLVISTPNGLTGACGAGTIAATAGSNVVSLSGGTVATNSSCSFSVNVTGTAPGQQNNTTGNVTSIEGGAGGTASASIKVEGPPSIAKAFNPSVIAPNTTSTLTFTITNPAANPDLLAGVSFTDALPAGLVVATPNALTNFCVGPATALAGSASISLSGGTVAANSNCTVTVNVTSALPGTYNNTTGAVSSANGGVGNAATAQLAVKNASLSIVKSHQGTFTRGQNGAQYTLTVSNAASAGPTTGTVTVVDTLPVISNSHNIVPVALSGTGWTCTLGTLTCTRVDALAPGASYPAITFTVNIPQEITNHFSNTATVSGGGDPSSHTGADPVNFGHALDITALTASATVSAGTPAMFSFTVDATAAPSPLGTVAFSCTNLPSAASCAFNPASENVDFATVALTMNTTPRSAISNAPFGLDSRPPMYALLLPGLGLAAIVLAGRRSKMRLRVAMASGALLLLAFSGCGGKPTPVPQNFTPSGTYTVTVNAAAGTTTSSTTVTLNVQ